MNGNECFIFDVCMRYIYIYPTGAQYIRSESLFKTDKKGFIIFYTTS